MVNNEFVSVDDKIRDEVLRVGEVSGVSGRVVTVKVDHNKNLSDIFFDGEILRNISVNSFLEIRKGFLRIIGKVDGERIEEEPIRRDVKITRDDTDINRRYLTVSLIGYIDLKNKFVAGMKELPLIGNEAYIVTKEKIDLIHNLVSEDDLKITIAKTEDDFKIDFPVDGLFNGHIAIFGNTGSGKSNTLAALYGGLVESLQDKNEDAYKKNMRFLLLDFNGEYTANDCITPQKEVYNLSTHGKGRRLPISEENLLDLEMLSILSDATEKTQKPFLKRTLRLYRRTKGEISVFRIKLEETVKSILKLKDSRAPELVEYIKSVLPETDKEVDVDIEFNHKDAHYKIKDTYDFLDEKPEKILETEMYKRVKLFNFDAEPLSKFIRYA